MAVLFFKLSCDFLNIIPWKRSCFPPSSIFFFKITYFKRAEKELHLISRYDDPSAPAVTCVRYCRGQPGKGIAVLSTETFHVLYPAFSSPPRRPVASLPAPAAVRCQRSGSVPEPELCVQSPQPGMSPFEQASHARKWRLGHDPGAEASVCSEAPWLLILGLSHQSKMTKAMGVANAHTELWATRRETFAVGRSWCQAPCLSPLRRSSGAVLSWDLAETSSVLS